MARLAYGELRTNAERIADAVVKERVLAGIDVLNEKYGPDWVDKVDPATLCLSSTKACVLGQVYDGAEIPENRYTPTGDGYWRGLILINGDVEENPEMYGFAADADDDVVVVDDDDDEDEDGDGRAPVTYDSLTSAWRIALGAEELTPA